jgi:hypothetical protein
MQFLIFKYLVTAAIIVLVSEVAKHMDRAGALLASLPLVTLLTLTWLYIEQQPAEKIAAHAWYTLWYVIPTLPMFATFPWLLGRVGFWPTMGISMVFTALCFLIFALGVKRFGIELM